jgi:hypothetical protein
MNKRFDSMENRKTVNKNKRYSNHKETRKNISHRQNNLDVEKPRFLLQKKREKA